MRLTVVIRPITHSEVYISGDVMIDEGAAIAPGVILQAEAESRIVIKSGCCLGMGTILRASDGVIEIEAGVILGAGVLIVGKGKIGHNACIGSATTILNSSIESNAVILAGSLIGDPSQEEFVATTPEPILSNEEKNEVEEEPSQTVTSAVENQQPETQVPPESKKPVVGQVYINQLLVTLFPERQSNSAHF